LLSTTLKCPIDIGEYIIGIRAALAVQVPKNRYDLPNYM
jgi:hypothetical protein